MNDKIIEELNQQLAGQPAEKVLEFFLSEYQGKIVQATSMGAEDQVITHLISRIDRETRIITLDTGRLYQETYDLIQQTREDYNMKIEVIFPDYRKLEEMVKERGINLFYKSIENRKLCCGIRKDDSLKRALRGMEVWICGLRKDQTISRFYNRLVEWDDQHGLIKVNPLINWTEKEVWEFIHSKDVPYNVLHDKGFPSIGCKPCTRAIQPGEDSRAGRWWWENSGQKECGLHNQPEE